MSNFLQSDVRKKKNENHKLSSYLTSKWIYFTGTLTEATSTPENGRTVEQLVMAVVFASYISYFHECLFSCFYRGINVY